MTKLYQQLTRYSKGQTDSKEITQNNKKLIGTTYAHRNKTHYDQLNQMLH